MSVTVAASAGFCFGVRRATEALERELEHPERTVCTLGRLIHNDGYNRSLEERGVRSVTADMLDGIFEECEAGKAYTVVVRAHGEDRAVLERLYRAQEIYPDFRVLDCT